MEQRQNKAQQIRDTIGFMAGSQGLSISALEWKPNPRADSRAYALYATMPDGEQYYTRFGRADLEGAARSVDNLAHEYVDKLLKRRKK